MSANRKQHIDSFENSIPNRKFASLSLKVGQARPTAGDPDSRNFSIRDHPSGTKVTNARAREKIDRKIGNSGMKVKTICLALITLGNAGYMYNQSSEAVTPIAQRAVATLKLPGFADFLVADGDAVWTTNQGRVEKLQRDHPQPVATVLVPDPCGAMEIGFGALWVANCQDASLYRIDLKATRVTAVIPTGLADPKAS